MVKKIFIFVFGFNLILFKSYAHNEYGRNQVVQVYRTLYKSHTDPPLLDSDFSISVFDKLIEELDPNHIHFTTESLRQLVEYREALQLEVSGTSWEFFNRLVVIYKNQLRETDTLIQMILSQPINLQKGLTITYPYRKTFHPANFAEKKEYLTRYYKNKLMRTAYLDRPNDTIKDPLSDKKLETELRYELLTSEKTEVEALYNSDEKLQKFVLDQFCNSIAKCFDPHSDFMPPAVKEKFIQEVSAEKYTFGIELEINDKDEFVISGLLPGGPAWETGDIQKGDVVVEIRYGNRKTVDLVSADIDDIYELLDKIDEEDLNIKVRKADGKVVDVELNKKVVADEESTVKSFILQGENRIGFISLPGFYSDFGKNGGKTCANDVAKEIWKLKKDSIDGLIIDLRYNGGGSVREAIDMSGIFINEGVVCFEKKGKEKPTALKDPNRGTSYDGPLLLLVNGQSASATELLSGTLQDYNRAIVVGGKTFGKATEQIVVPADSNLAEKALLGMKTNENPKNGYVKVTIGKVYLPTGRSIQCNGVQPDILLPDLFDSLSIREKDKPHCLKADSVKKAIYFTPLDKLPLMELADKSQKRIEKNPTFNTIRKISGYYRRMSEDSREVTLDWDQYIKLKLSDNKFLASLNKSDKSDALKNYAAENLSYDKEWINRNEDRKESNAEWLDELQTDIFLNESYLILGDYLKILNQKK